MKRDKLASLFLRIGLASVFIYIAYDSIINPETWIAFMPTFIRELSYSRIIFNIFAYYQIFLGVWLITNKKVFYAGILAALTTFGTFILALKFLDIAFRDLAIMFAALALIMLEWKNR